MVGFDGEQQKIREGMEDDSAVIAEITLGVHGLRQPKAHVLCEEQNRRVVNGKVHLGHVGIECAGGDSFGLESRKASWYLDSVRFRRQQVRAKGQAHCQSESCMHV
jgi:hypothetical protein